SYILGDGIKKQLSSTIYHYKTEDDYDPNKVNKLTNQVSCLTDDQGSTEEVTLGRNEEIFFVLNENSSLNHELGLDVNFEVAPPAFAIIPIPHGSYSEMSMKTAVGHKIIRKSGVLDHVEVWDGQSRVVTKNRYFDLETGSPIVTEVINEHEDPVVSFNYPGNWSYDHLGGAYQNVLAEFSKYTMPTSSFANMSGNDMVFTGINVEDYFVEGDEVFIEGSSFASLLAHVIEVDDVANSILCVEKDGDLISSALTDITKVTIVNSGRKNMQSVSTGGIVSLGEIPFKNILPPMFNVFNQLAYDGSSMSGNIQLCDGTDLGPENTYTFTIRSNVINITVNASGETCRDAKISCTDCGDTRGFMTNAQDVTITSFDPLTNQVTYTIIDQYGVSHEKNGILSDENGCVESCFKGVLQASAVEFTDDWSINCLANSCGFTEADAVDPYTIGLRGSWRPFKSYAYVTDRENNGDIREDGLFEDFAFYDWNDPASVDDKWRNASEITKYSPYGFEVENVNAIGNYSAAIYGYGGSLPIAVAQNARYNEALYDGFEDYSMLINDGCEVEEHHWTVPAVGNITDEEAHTGNYSFKQTSGTTSTIISLSNPDCAGDNTSETSGQIVLEDCGCNGQFNPYNGSGDSVLYYVSAWVKQSGVTAPVIGSYDNANLQIKVDANTYSILPTDVIIEGWQKLEGYVPIVSGASSVTIYFNNSYEVPADVYFDDFRIHPANANMGAFVYDPGNLQSTAQLDANNFATFFIYDDEGKLYQKKVETREGIKTIQVGRSAQIIE
ncbi:MAG: hypothetical protein MI810_01810, partial [Flavobacteriales bacterium]|nr:hypothetical protein [Flavobacteriales bacterium]